MEGENAESGEAGGYSRRSLLSVCVKAQQREKTPSTLAICLKC